MNNKRVWFGFWGDRTENNELCSFIIFFVWQDQCWSSSWLFSSCLGIKIDPNNITPIRYILRHYHTTFSLPTSLWINSSLYRFCGVICSYSSQKFISFGWAARIIFPCCETVISSLSPMQRLLFWIISDGMRMARLLPHFETIVVMSLK